MSQRLNPYKIAPEMLEPMNAMEEAIKNSGIEHSLINIVKTRASQINGCAYCVNMHTHEARAAGEIEERLYLLSTWWESSLYSPRERAALAWTDSLTLISETRADDAAYNGLKDHFDEAEIVKLTIVITAINAWNRIAVGFRFQHPKPKVKAA